MKKKNMFKMIAAIFLSMCIMIGGVVGINAMFVSSNFANTTGKVGNVVLEDIKLSLNDTSNKDIANLDPGSINKFSFEVSNLGNKSVSERSTIYLLIINKGGDDSNLEDSLFLYPSTLSDANIKTDIENGTPIKNIGTPVTGISYDNQQYDGWKLNFEQVLNGTGVGKEIEENISIDKITHDFKLAFSQNANADTMNAEFKFLVITEAVQYRNTLANYWSSEPDATYTITI